MQFAPLLQICESNVANIVNLHKKYNLWDMQNRCNESFTAKEGSTASFKHSLLLHCKSTLCVYW